LDFGSIADAVVHYSRAKDGHIAQHALSFRQKIDERLSQQFQVAFAKRPDAKNSFRVMLQRTDGFALMLANHAPGAAR
jgi:hypothetical protein